MRRMLDIFACKFNFGHDPLWFADMFKVVCNYVDLFVFATHESDMHRRHMNKIVFVVYAIVQNDKPCVLGLNNHTHLPEIKLVIWLGLEG